MSNGRGMGKRGLIAAVILVLGLIVHPSGAEEDVAVPLPLQMELLLKVAAYDRNLPARARDTVEVLILTKNGDAQSTHVATQAGRALDGKRLADRPVHVVIEAHVDGARTAKRIRELRAAIVYAAPGFSDDEMTALGRSLDGVDVLSAGALARFVQTGVVVAFDLVSGKPKLLVHIKRAREQNVDLSSKVLKLAKVIE